MTRTRKAIGIVAAVAVLTVSAAFAAYAVDLHRTALWQVVRACVADFKLTGSPFPCLNVDLADGEEGGSAVLRPFLSNDTIVMPTRRITGVEDPILQSPEVANYFEAAWRARTFLADADGRIPARDEIALFVNSAFVRTQDQLHIHMGCLRPYARRTLAAVAPTMPMGEWTQIGPVVPHTTFWGYRIAGTELANVNPFRLAADELSAQTIPGDLTVVVVGAEVEGEDQFLILASYSKAPHAWWPVGADNLLGVCRPAAARRAG